jgi:hypothetical protein
MSIARGAVLGLVVLTIGCNGSEHGGPSADAAPVVAPDAETPAPPGDLGDAAQPTADAPAVGSPAPADAAPSDAPSAPAAGDVTVTAFAGTNVYFAGMDNKRIVDAPVTFPEAAASFQSITLNLALRCPSGGCDPWDRRAFLGLVRKVDGKDSVTEVLRFMTPYGVPARWTEDVTPLRPLLTGAVTMRVFIDTWVGPTSAGGTGWLVDATFVMKAGTPARRAIAVLPVWDEGEVDYGDPAKPISTTAPTQMIAIPAGATAVELRSFLTGHGQGNAGNCSEFCSKKHTFTVGTQAVSRDVWRSDCAANPLNNQRGNWKPNRAGWCPGADVPPWVADVTAAAPAGTTVPITYDVAAYENSCRPDSPRCSGCVFATPCAYDDGAHTRPFFDLSAALIVYGSP